VTNLFKVMWKIDDELSFKLNGTDYTLYLCFLKHCIWVFTILVIFGCIFLFPVYETGTQNDEAKEKYDQDPLNNITLINITNDDKRMLWAFLVSQVVVPTWAFCGLYLYSLSKKKNE
jgi:hypothetical protein